MFPIDKNDVKTLLGFLASCFIFYPFGMIHPMIDHQIYGSVTVNTKGQIIIPKEARKVLGIKAGDKLLVTSKGKCVLGLIKASNVQEFIDKMQMNLD